jgi:hypothetical protein
MLPVVFGAIGLMGAATVSDPEFGAFWHSKKKRKALKKRRRRWRDRAAKKAGYKSRGRALIPGQILFNPRKAIKYHSEMSKQRSKSREAKRAGKWAEKAYHDEVKPRGEWVWDQAQQAWVKVTDWFGVEDFDHYGFDDEDLEESWVEEEEDFEQFGAFWHSKKERARRKKEREFKRETKKRWRRQAAKKAGYKKAWHARIPGSEFFTPKKKMKYQAQMLKKNLEMFALYNNWKDFYAEWKKYQKMIKGGKKSMKQALAAFQQMQQQGGQISRRAQKAAQKAADQAKDYYGGSDAFWAGYEGRV